jgi:hypothetical protein
MTPHDVGVFQFLAGLITLCIVLLTIFAFRFMRAMEDSGRNLMDLALRVEEGLNPILLDLRSGAAQFRTACEHTRHVGEQLGELGDRLERLMSFTKTGPGGIWPALGKLAGAFFTKPTATNGE